MKTMRCRYFIGMSCVQTQEKGEDAACLEALMVMTGNGSAQVRLHTDMEYLRRHCPKVFAPVLENDIRNIFSAFYTEEVTLSKTCKGSAILQCGSGINTGCSLYHAVRRNCLRDRNLSISPSEKTVVVPCTQRIRDSRRNTVPSRSEADGRMRNV